ncbi:hypothetical protein HY989_04570 [Candidatus Micrarchaeota archaeon]|nr:hypothetical protein [Candidatus Micrarchaeota archaeon]
MKNTPEEMHAKLMDRWANKKLTQVHFDALDAILISDKHTTPEIFHEMFRTYYEHDDSEPSVRRFIAKHGRWENFVGPLSSHDALIPILKPLFSLGIINHRGDKFHHESLIEIPQKFKKIVRGFLVKKTSHIFRDTPFAQDHLEHLSKLRFNHIMGVALREGMYFGHFKGWQHLLGIFKKHQDGIAHDLMPPKSKNPDMELQKIRHDVRKTREFIEQRAREEQKKN